MSQASDEETLARLLELLALAPDPDRALEGSELSGNPEAERLLAELRTIERRLDESARAGRDEIAEAGRLEDVPGEALVRPILERLNREAPAGEPLPGVRNAASRGERWLAPTRLRWLGIAAAAALLVVWFARPLFGPHRLPQDTLLGSAAGLQAHWGPSGWTFAWRIEPPPAGHFVVRIFAPDAAGAGKGRTLAASPSIRTQEWSPEPESSAGWPDSVLWELEVYDGSSPRPARSYSAEATRQ